MMIFHSRHKKSWALCLFLLLNFAGAACDKEVISKSRTNPEKKARKWEGSPFIAWESQGFKYNIFPKFIFRNYILIFQGIYNRGKVFNPEKAVLFASTAGRTKWRKALRPVMSSKFHPYTTKSEVFVKKTGKKLNIALVSWVLGDLFRGQNMKTGDDIWNLPDCSHLVKTGKELWGICFDTLKKLDPFTGKTLEEKEFAIKPLKIIGLPEDLVLLDKKGNLQFYQIKTEKLYSFPKEEKLYHIAVSKEKNYIYTVSRGDFGYLLKMYHYHNNKISLKWKTSLSVLTDFFWIFETENIVILPAGFDCITARNLKDGKEAWTSCGVFTENPPAYDENGLYVLSSRVKKNEHPLLFLDAFNGLQTPIFRNEGKEDTYTYRAVFLTPGKAKRGLIYGVHKNSKIFALRVAGK
ncbi:MAG: hypothetical protein ACQES9_01300 [Myxococcota bacterium]